MTYLNESEIDEEGYKTISFGSLENSPNNAPHRLLHYRRVGWITISISIIN